MANELSNRPGTRSGTEARFAAVAVVGVAFALRLLQLASSINSPLTYQLSPDEDYYLRFGEAVSAWHGQNSAEFTFMDSGYGFLLGAIFRVFGPNLFVVFMLQAVLEIIHNLGRSLDAAVFLPNILDSLFEIFPQAERGYVLLVNPEDGQLIPQAMKFRRGEAGSGLTLIPWPNEVEATASSSQVRGVSGRALSTSSTFAGSVRPNADKASGY